MEHLGAAVRITTEAIAAIQREAHAARERGTETAVYLFARDGVIVRAIRAGHPVEHAAMCRPDYAAAEQLFAAERERDGAQAVGEAHVHFNLSGPSGGDISTLRDVARNQDWPGFLCIVANITTADAPANLTCHSVDRDGIVHRHELDVLQERDEYQPLIPADRRKVKYLQLGLGSGGCTVAHHSGLWNIKQLTFVDHDKLVPRNAERHYAPRRAAGKKKTAWISSFLKARTTSIIRTYAREISPQSQAWLDRLIEQHDLVGECTGHPVTREIVSEACKQLGKPVVFAGVFAKASGGYVFVQHAKPEAACNRCLFKLTRHSTNDDAQTIETLTRDYGFTPEQLNAQIGVFTDVSMTAILQAKILLDLIKGIEHPTNLYLIDNQALTLRKAFVKQSSTCSLCHPTTE